MEEHIAVLKTCGRNSLREVMLHLFAWFGHLKLDSTSSLPDGVEFVPKR